MALNWRYSLGFLVNRSQGHCCFLVSRVSCACSCIENQLILFYASILLQFQFSRLIYFFSDIFNCIQITCSFVYVVTDKKCSCIANLNI